MVALPGKTFDCTIFTQSVNYSRGSPTNPTFPYEYKHKRKVTFHLGWPVITGTNSIVFSGLTIVEGCSVDAFAVVTHSIEPRLIYVGIPAKAVKPRKQALLAFEQAWLDSEKGES